MNNTKFLTQRRALLAGFVAPLTMAGCGSIKTTPHAPEGMAITQGSAGTLLGSIGLMPRHGFTSVNVFFRTQPPTPGMRHGRFMFSATGVPGLDSPVTYNMGGGKGQSFAIELAAGEYEAIVAFANAPYGIRGDSVFFASGSLALRFQIQPNKATYIGSWMLSRGDGLAQGLPRSGRIDISNELERDRQALQARAGEAARPIIVAVPTSTIELPQTRG
jgi:hypothetical protein